MPLWFFVSVCLRPNSYRILLSNSFFKNECWSRHSFLSKVFTYSLLTTVGVNPFLTSDQSSHPLASTTCGFTDAIILVTFKHSFCGLFFCICVFPCTRPVQVIPANGIHSKSICYFWAKKMNMCVYFHSLFLFSLLETHYFFNVIKNLQRAINKQKNNSHLHIYW